MYFHVKIRAGDRRVSLRHRKRVTFDEFSSESVCEFSVRAEGGERKEWGELLSKLWLLFLFLASGTKFCHKISGLSAKTDIERDANSQGESLKKFVVRETASRNTEPALHEPSTDRVNQPTCRPTQALSDLIKRHKTQ